MPHNFNEKRCIEALYEILDRLLMLYSTLHGADAVQAYVYAAFRILDPLEAEMIKLDKIRNEEHEAYINSLVNMDCPFELTTKQTNFGGK